MRNRRRRRAAPLNPSQYHVRASSRQQRLAISSATAMIVSVQRVNSDIVVLQLANSLDRLFDSHNRIVNRAH